MAAPHAPWSLTGECVLAWAASPAGELPADLCALPGPALVTAARFESSPVGPYLELAVSRPARLGARPGMCVTLMVVDTHDACVGGRVNWGFPKEVGALQWEESGDERALTWREREVRVQATPSGPAMPVVLPMRALQRRADGLVVVPGRLRGRARVSRVEIEAAEGDTLAALAGQRRGLLVSGLKLAVDPARRPTGLSATLRAPLRAPEPALSSGGRNGHRGD